MRNICDKLKKFRNILVKYYKNEIKEEFLEEVEREYLLKFKFRKLHNIIDLGKMQADEIEIFYGVMHIYANKILEDLIVKYCEKEDSEKLLNSLKNNFAIKYIASEFPKHIKKGKMTKEEEEIYGEIIMTYI